MDKSANKQSCTGKSCVLSRGSRIERVGHDNRDLAASASSRAASRWPSQGITAASPVPGSYRCSASSNPPPPPPHTVPPLPLVPIQTTRAALPPHSDQQPLHHAIPSPPVQTRASTPPRPHAAEARAHCDGRSHSHCHREEPSRPRSRPKHRTSKSRAPFGLGPPLGGCGARTGGDISARRGTGSLHAG